MDCTACSQYWGKDLYSRNLKLLVPFFEQPSISLQGIEKVCAIKAPGFGENMKSNLQDLAILIGGQVITEELSPNLEKVEPELLGSCKKVTISKDDTVVLDGAGDKKAIGERCEQLRSTIELSTSDYDKEKLQERLAASGC